MPCIKLVHNHYLPNITIHLKITFILHAFQNTWLHTNTTNKHLAHVFSLTEMIVVVWKAVNKIIKAHPRRMTLINDEVNIEI